MTVPMKNKRALLTLGVLLAAAFAAGFLLGRSAPNPPNAEEADIVISYPSPNQTVSERKGAKSVP